MLKQKYLQQIDAAIKDLGVRFEAKAILTVLEDLGVTFNAEEIALQLNDYENRTVEGDVLLTLMRVIAFLGREKGD